VFGLVLGLLAWLYLQAQITLYAVELNVVKARRLWPRSLFPPPLTKQDLEAYRLYAQAEQRRPELEIEVRETRKARKAREAREAREAAKAREDRQAQEAREDREAPDTEA
jgi:hypothetical protein